MNVEAIFDLNTSKTMLAMFHFFTGGSSNDLWVFFTYEFGEDPEVDVSCVGNYSDNMFLNFAHSSVYALLDFIYHIICIPLASIACFVFVVYVAINDDVHKLSIIDRIRLALTAPLFAAILVLALTLALPTRLISSVVSPIVKCAEDALQEPATPTI